MSFFFITFVADSATRVRLVALAALGALVRLGGLGTLAALGILGALGALEKKDKIENNKKNRITMINNYKILRKPTNWRELYFYQKADALYQLTAVFCKRFFPPYGDRTVDQMMQAARSGKQNIVEGIEDGMTSSEMEIKLINVSRSSLQELREDYEDYLKVHGLVQWDAQHPRYDKMLEYSREHNEYEHFEKLAETMDDEGLANMAITLCHLTDKMICSYLEHLEKRFVKEGGIKERMHAARTGYRQQQDQHTRSLQQELIQMKQQLLEKEAEIAALKRRLGEE